MNKLSCEECRSDRIVECWSAGDMVCSNCGLVQYGGILDDRSVDYGYQDVHYFDDNVGSTSTIVDARDCKGFDVRKLLKYQHQCGRKTDTGANAFRQELSKMGLDNTIVATTAIDLFTRAIQDIGSKHIKTVVMAVSLYYSCKLHKNATTLVEICDAFSVSEKRFWQHSTSVLESWKSLPNFKHIMVASSKEDILVRMVYSVPGIPQEKIWNIVNVARNVQARVADSSLQTLKASKLNCTIIYIACSIALGPKSISKACLSNGFGVSITTINKHENLIQSILISDT
jgi:transcription initiation factor TFIIIB Brf1 subunit/transcription initiation factor TFIIB